MDIQYNPKFTFSEAEIKAVRPALHAAASFGVLSEGSKVDGLYWTRQLEKPLNEFRFKQLRSILLRTREHLSVLLNTTLREDGEWAGLPELRAQRQREWNAAQRGITIIDTALRKVDRASRA
jgi:hypothetical protein